MAEYVRNLWYVAAWEEEVEGDARLARTLLDEPMVIWRLRGEEGRYGVVADRCPHRFAPLSQGRRDGDQLVCPYHGLQFDAAGACTRSPFPGAAPKTARVKSCPAVARHGLVWFWPGDPALADAGKIPDFGFLQEQDIRRGRSCFAANYELLTDNLMDLSHVEFIHQDSFHPNGAAFRGRYKVREGEAGSIWSDWFLPGVNPPPFVAEAAPAGAPVNQHLEMRWQAPACMMLDITWALGDADQRDPLFRNLSPHIVTPETATTSHYFWTSEPSDEAEALARRVFEAEDQPILEAIQRTMGEADFWDLKPIVVQGDAGAIYARRRLGQMRRSEHPASAAA